MRRNKVQSKYLQLISKYSYINFFIAFSISSAVFFQVENFKAYCLASVEMVSLYSLLLYNRITASANATGVTAERICSLIFISGNVAIACGVDTMGSPAVKASSIRLINPVL